jgi:hypothetical protein
MSDVLHCGCDIEDVWGGVPKHSNDCIVGAIQSVARALRSLGSYQTSTSLGAVDVLGMTIANAAVTVANGLGEIATVVDGQDDADQRSYEGAPDVPVLREPAS